MMSLLDFDPDPSSLLHKSDHAAFVRPNPFNDVNSLEVSSRLNECVDVKLLIKEFNEALLQLCPSVWVVLLHPFNRVAKKVTFVLECPQILSKDLLVRLYNDRMLPSSR